jgi:hypothetical protein
VKLAASILVCFSASRQSREFPANAVIATNVRMKTRVAFTRQSFTCFSDTGFGNRICYG